MCSNFRPDNIVTIRHLIKNSFVAHFFDCLFIFLGEKQKKTKQNKKKDTNLNAFDSDGNTALMHACNSSQDNIALELIESPFIDISIKNTNLIQEYTALEFAGVVSLCVYVCF